MFDRLPVSEHKALQFSVKGSMLSVVSPRDPVLSEALKKDAGMQWQPQASVWRTQVTDANVGKLNEVFTKLGTYLIGQALQATPTERGLTSNEIAAPEKPPQPSGMPLDEKSMRHVDNAMQLVSRTFTPTELADLRDLRSGEHIQSSLPRVAALSTDTFDRITKAVTTAQTAYQAVNGMKFDAIADGADALPLNTKLKELDAERSRLASELEAAPEEKPLIHPAMAIAYRERVATLAQALYDEEFGRQAFERLRAMVEAVVLTPLDGHLAIELRGELAGILRVAVKEGQFSDFAQRNALQIKMVAGAGFEPTTFRL